MREKVCSNAKQFALAVKKKHHYLQWHNSRDKGSVTPTPWRQNWRERRELFGNNAAIPSEALIGRHPYGVNSASVYIRITLQRFKIFFSENLVDIIIS